MYNFFAPVYFTGKTFTVSISHNRSSHRFQSAKTIPRQPVAEDVILAAPSAENRIQSGSAGVQSPQHIDAVVPRRVMD